MGEGRRGGEVGCEDERGRESVKGDMERSLTFAFCRRRLAIFFRLNEHAISLHYINQSLL